jgi:hypothetical protein
VHGHTQVGGGLPQGLQVGAAVFVVDEDRLVMMAALQHVVRQSGNGKAGQTSHGKASVKGRL